ncbi:MAG: flagellar biosynthetic protein FliO [Acidobacteriia bacterium]|nr:flagellar biosynthetic protein FliO [Terriglobia bacterium]
MNTLSQVEPLQPVQDKSRTLPSVGDWSQTLLARIWSVLKWIVLRAKAQQGRKNLRVCETVSLGEKRFVAVVQVDEERFLIGGSSSAVSLLTRLQETKTFAAALDQEAANIS